MTCLSRTKIALVIAAVLSICLAFTRSGHACYSLRRQQEYEDKPPITRRELIFISLVQLQQLEKDESVLTPARKAIRFLIENMHDPDLSKVTASTLVQVTLRRVRRRLQRWPKVPWDIFVEFTLPYAVLSEPRDASLSSEFLDKLQGHVDKMVPPGATLLQAATILNRKAYAITTPPIQFKESPPNKVNAYSPFEVVRDKFASCTGESVFLVYALREMGIPARVAGVPHWTRDDKTCPEGDRSPACGNHNWVEAYTEKGWVFFDQNTDSPANKAWFFPDLTNALVPDGWYHAIYASTWRYKSKLHFPLVFDPTYVDVSAIERTSWYQNVHPSSNLGEEANEGSALWMDSEEEEASDELNDDNDHVPNIQVA